MRGGAGSDPQYGFFITKPVEYDKFNNRENKAKNTHNRM